jgi:hypothetical protein
MYQIKFTWGGADSPVWHVSKFNETLTQSDSLSLSATYLHLVRSFHDMLASKGKIEQVEGYAHYRIVNIHNVVLVRATPTVLLQDYKYLVLNGFPVTSCTIGI